MNENKREALKAKVDELLKVSTIPAILTKVMAVVEDEEGTAFELKKIIEHDQSISSRVVAMANSAFYGMPRQVASLPQAILVLGFETVKNIAVSISIFENLGSRCRLDVTELWVHSMKVALCARLVAQKTGCVDRDTAFLGGLLHDIGRAVLLQIFDGGYLDLSMPGGEGLIEREEQTLGASHCEVGGWLAERYQLPEECVNAIRYHHFPEQCPTHRSSEVLFHLLPVVFLADYIVSEGTSDFANDCPSSTGQYLIMDSLGLKPGEFAEIKVGIEAMDEDVRRFFRP